VRFHLGLLCAITLSAQDPLFLSTQKKFDQIDAGSLKPHAVVQFSPAELNAWARVKVVQTVQQGMRDTAIQLGSGTATGSALVDFLKMRQAQGRETPWLISKMIEGERPLKVEVRLTSSGGQATVNVLRVELSGTALSGRTLDFLISNFFKPLYPDAKIGEPFDLGYNMERIEVQPAMVRVFMK
jgi:hypothetical protein